jgi:hypothetical protein
MTGKLIKISMAIAISAVTLTSAAIADVLF